ncbi:MAG TPA: DUF2194 domain-containing protein [Bacilli bacterium]|nr:DUF2194 domain-containing protein [Bacilli bacterium]
MAFWRTKGRKIAYLLLIVTAVTATSLRVTDWWQTSHQKRDALTYGETYRTDIPESRYQRYLLLHHAKQDIEEADLTLANLERALTNAKLPYDEMSFAEWNKFDGKLDAYRDGAIILIGERQATLQHTERLERYVREQGGLLVNAIRSAESPLNAFMGIEGEPDFVKGKVTGWRWTAPIYPGLSEAELSAERVTSSSLTVGLSPQVKIWAQSTGDRVEPYLWQREQGKGHTLYWNTLLLQEKMWRGPFLQTLLKAQGAGGKLMVGAQVWFLDDFPSPAYDRVSEGNRTGLTDFQFRLQRWDPDMQEIARKYGIRYSSGAILIYNDRVKPPFAFNRDPFAKLYGFETSLMEKTGELGLHGYNHMPLTLAYTEEQEADLGYPAWPSVAEMEQALRFARARWLQEAYGRLPTFYIPPSNILSPEGKQVLLRVFPELKTISSLYQADEAGGALEQEFAPDPDFPQVMGTPRITYGYALSEDELHDLYAGLADIGIVSHFNHPDDVFNEDRNQGKTWNELRDAFEGVVGSVQDRFSFLQPVTATELADALRRYQAAEVRIDASQDERVTAYVTPLSGPVFLELHLEAPERWQAVRGGEIVGRQGEYDLLWVKVTGPQVVLEVKR